MELAPVMREDRAHPTTRTRIGGAESCGTTPVSAQGFARSRKFRKIARFAGGADPALDWRDTDRWRACFLQEISGVCTVNISTNRAELA